MPTAVQVVFSILAAILQDAPELIADLEALIASVRGGTPPPQPPVGPQVRQDVEAEEQKLDNPPPGLT